MAEIKAKRAYEQSEREIKQKEKDEQIIRQKKLEEFKQLNEKILNDKKRILIENARREKEEYDLIIKKQLAEKEKDRREEEIKKRKI